MGLAAYFSPLSSVPVPRIPSLSYPFRNEAEPNTGLNLKAKPPINPIKKPSHWTTELMPFEGGYVPCYVSRAENEEAVAGLNPGMSSCPVDWYHEVELLNQRGISVVSIGLHHTEDYSQYYNINRRLSEVFYYDENCSPLYKIGDRGLNRFAIAHSTSAPIFIHNLSREGALQRKPTTLVGAAYLNPLMDTYHSSVGHYPLRNAALTAFMMYQGEEPIGTSRLEKKIMGEKATDHDPLTYPRPEWKRVKHTRAQARELSKAIINGQRADVSAFPQKMYLGSEDTQICNFRAQDVAYAASMEARIFEGVDHYSIIKNNEALNDIAWRIKAPKQDVALNTERQQQQTELTSAHAALA